MRDPSTGVSAYLERPVYSTAGPQLGVIDDVLLDARSRAPHWIVIRLLGPLRRHRAVPLVLVLEEQGRLALPLTALAVRHSPRLPRRADLTTHDELALRRYWLDH